MGCSLHHAAEQIALPDAAGADRYGGYLVGVQNGGENGQAGQDGVDPVGHRAQDLPQGILIALFQPLVQGADLPGGDDPVVRVGPGQVVAQLGGGPECAAHAGQVFAPKTGGLGPLQFLLHVGADGLPLLLGGEKAGDVFGEEGQGAHGQGTA